MLKDMTVKIEDAKEYLLPENNSRKKNKKNKNKKNRKKLKNKKISECDDDASEPEVCSIYISCSILCNKLMLHILSFNSHWRQINNLNLGNEDIPESSLSHVNLEDKDDFSVWIDHKITQYKEQK